MNLDILGFFGMAMILTAFIMNQTHKWKDDFLVYDLFNALGGLMMSAYAFLIKGYPFLILNSVWSLVSIRDVILDLKYVKKVNKSHIAHKKK